MSLSFPRPHTDVRILEEDSLQERLRALDLTPGLRASVGAGLVELAGSAAFLNHPTQSLLQDRVTLHYRTSTRLDMLSHTLLNSVPPLSLTNQNKATHVVVAVLYGTQAFFVFDNDTESSEGSIILKDVVKRNFISHSAAELLSDLDENQKANCLSDCTVYTDAADFKSTKNFNTMRQMFFQNFLEPHSQSLKVWLYPLKNLDQTAPCVSGELSEDLLLKAEIVLESLKCKCDSCQEIKSLYHYLDVISCFPAMMESFSEISALLVKYRSEFQSALASCIKNIRERGVEEEECGLRDLLNRHDQSPFSPENIQQWFHNRDAEVMALILCRDNNVTIVQSEEELIDILQDSQDTVWCFTLTSLEREDPFLSALKQHIPLHTLKIQDTQFRLPDTSERILSDLQAFLAKKELEKNEQQIKFITAYISGPHSPSPSIRLYQSGSLVSYNVKLDVEPNLPEIITVKQTSVILNLQRGVKRVEYRAISSRRMNSLDMKWRAEVLCSTGEKCEVLDLTPDTQYELRYAVMDSNSMSNYSRITEFWTLPRSTPGQPRVLKHTQNVLTVAWETVAGDSPVLHYMVEYMEAGLEGWQSILTEGPVCKCTIKLPYSTCYRVRVSAVYGEEDTSRPSTEAEVPVDKWYVNLSKRKASLFIEVLKLQTEKKPVKLRDWSNEESEVSSFLQCLPYISQLSFGDEVFYQNGQKRRSVMEFLLKLTVAAAEWDVDTGESFTKLMMSVCSSPYFPLDEYYGGYRNFYQCDFLLDLYSHVKDYETQTGRSVLPALQPVYQSAPAVWNIDLSERKTSLFLEVLKLQTVKKPVELRNWSDEESEVRSFLQCLPYISDLRGAEQYLPSLCKELHSREQVAALLQTLDSTLSLGGELSTSSCRAVGRVLALSASTPNLTLTPRAISLRGARLLFTHVTHLHTLRLSSRVVGRMVRALRVVRAPAPLTIQELSLILTDTQQTEGALSRVLSSLASLLRLWNVQCLNLTEYKMEAQSLTVLLSHRGPLTIRVCKETLQQLVVVVYEGQEEELTHCFLQKVGGDLTSCTLNWEEIHYFLQYQPVTVDFRKSNFKQQNPRELLAVLDRLQFRGVDRLLLLRLLHCCSVYELQQGAAAAVLLSTLQHRLDFSCSSALDLTEDTQTHTLTLSTEDCRVVSMAIQRAHTHTHLTLHDCEIEEAGVEQLFPILHRVTLHCSKSMLLQFLSLVRVGTELECVRRSVALSRALGGEVDLSHTRLDQQACRSLVLVLEHSEGLSELDLSHCQLTDDCLQLLFPHLHKTNVLDLSHNDITDRGVAGVYSAVSSNSNMQAIRLFNNPITDRQLFVSDRRFEIW